MHRIAIRALLPVLVLVQILSGGPVNATAATPKSLVGEFHDALLETMKTASTQSIRERFKRLESPIENSFHLGLMIQIASGSFWKQASKPQKHDLISAFSRLSVSTYASRFDGYSGQEFKTIDEKNGPQKTVLVRSKVVNSDGKDVALTYVTRQVEGSWRIVDILLSTGISELAQRRSEYRKVLKERGISGLIETLNSKADSLLAQ